MPKKDPVGSGSLLPIFQAVAGVAMSGYAWALLEPISFHAQVPPLALRFLTGSATGAVLGAIVLWRPRRSPAPTWEDWACGHYVTGLPGSGKTAFAYLMVREFCRNGWGWIWLSIKSSLSLLQYLPTEARSRCVLFAPYSDNPRGINLLRCYTGTATERELIADQVAELFDRLHPAMSGNMRELIRMGALALLQWAGRVQCEVTLWELYRFFQEDAFRGKVLAASPRPVRDAFSADEARRTTLQAVRVQLRRSVASENLLVALSQTDGIDLWDVMTNEGEPSDSCQNPSLVMSTALGAACSTGELAYRPGFPRPGHVIGRVGHPIRSKTPPIMPLW